MSMKDQSCEEDRSAGQEAIGRVLSAERSGKSQAMLHFEQILRIDFASPRICDAGLKRLLAYVGKNVAVLVLEEPVRRLNLREIKSNRRDKVGVTF